MITTNFDQFTPNITNQIVPDFTQFSSVEVEQPRILDLSNIGVQEELPSWIDITENGDAIVQDNMTTPDNSQKQEYSQSQLFDNSEVQEIPQTSLQQPEQVIIPEQTTPTQTTSQLPKSKYMKKMRLNNTQKNVAIDLMNGLIKRGLSPIEAAGLLGNIAQESQFNFSAWNRNDLGSASGGLVQWRGDRLTKLKSFAKSKGKPWTNKEVQLDFLMYELNTSYSSIRNKAKSASTPYDASEAFAGYEAYAGYDGTLKSAKSLQKSKKWSDQKTMEWINQQHESRGNYAEEIYKLWSEAQ